MSWQTYVDSNLVGTGKIAKAAIVGLDGGVWATTAGYTIAPAEIQALIAGYANEKALEGVQANGLRFAGQKFFVLLSNLRSIYGKNKADGVIVVKTKQAILVAEYVAPVQAAEATPVVEGLADYLISVGY